MSVELFSALLAPSAQESIIESRELPNFVREYSTFGESLHKSPGKPAGLSPFHEGAWSTFAERS